MPVMARDVAVGGDVVVMRLKNWKILSITGELLNDCYSLFNFIILAHTACSGIRYDSVIVELPGQDIASTVETRRR
jgi:hypothetical protein